jgi:acetylornithine deacetylase
VRAVGDLERAALAAVSADRIVADLLALVAVPSVTGTPAEAGAADLVARQLAAGGRAITVARRDDDPVALAGDPAFPGTETPRQILPLVAGWVPAGRPGRRLVLSGHLDVVPPGDPGTWSNSPFAPAISAGRVVGRGACDMKGGVVAAVEALRAVASLAGPDGVLPAPLAGEALFVGVPSEEDGGAGTLAAIRAGWTGDAAIVTEPTRLQVVTAGAGAITFRLTVPGRAAHASTRAEGVSAIEKLEVLHAALRADEARRSEAETDERMRALGIPYPTIIGIVHGGDWASTVPDRVVAEGRYGVRLGQDADGAFVELQAVIAEACAGDPWLRGHPAIVDDVGGRFDAVELAADDPLPTSLARVAAEVDGVAPAAVAVPYGSDMRLWVRVGATPCVLYGPGDVRGAHAADESVAIDEVVRCARVLTAWLVRGLAES